MNPLFILLLIILVPLLFLYIFLYLFHRKLWKLEHSIINSFRSRTDVIPSIYEISKKYLTRHQDIFKEVLRLRKNEFSLLEKKQRLYNVIELEEHIHHEINFIFKVCNKHPKLLKNGNFLYISDIVAKKSEKLWWLISLYKMMTKKFNYFIKLKNYSVVWFLLPISRKKEI